jgi:hypothetical protein
MAAGYIDGKDNFHFQTDAKVPDQFKAVVACKANVYHGGNVISRNVFPVDGLRKTLGAILPGKYSFGTDQREIMRVVSGSANVKVKGEPSAKPYCAGDAWTIPAKSSFEIEVSDGFFEYYCEYLDEVIPDTLEVAQVGSKANVYHDGKVISRNIFGPADSSGTRQRKTLGIIFPGKYSFGTEKKENMQVVAGHARVQVKGTTSPTLYSAGENWIVPANSSFEIEVTGGIFEYLCDYLDEPLGEDHLAGASVSSTANFYHNGKVISRNVFFPDGSRKTVGVIMPGKYNFGTEKKEKMQVVSGSAKVQVKGASVPTVYSPGEFWMVPASSSFDIEVDDGIFEYCCDYLDA